jgi:iron(II)-dependent oxidoreductase
MGSEESEREKPLHQVIIPYDYWLARYPVTVAQFRAFVQASGYQPRDTDSLEGFDNQPVVYVTWYDALAFCDWLTQAWQAQGRLAAGWRVTLPGEAEWEKAARGGLELPVAARVACIGSLQGSKAATQPNPLPQRRYPWGDEVELEKANYGDTGLGRTSAVGCFAGGVTPYGCEDMSGNVWEWTRSLWGKDFEKPDYRYPYNPADGREDLGASTNVLRVLRGGSFFLIQNVVRGAYRFRSLPNSWDLAFGFRVVVSPIL